MCATSSQDLEQARVRSERQAQLLATAEAARAAAEADRQRLQTKFIRSDKGTAMLRAARLKMEADALKEQLAAAEAALRDQACIPKFPLLACFHTSKCHPSNSSSSRVLMVKQMLMMCYACTRIL